jgi:hypothetical protein
MNYAVNIETRDSHQLIVTPRKRSLKHSVLYIQSGLALVKLGKKEYAMEPGQVWWLPADCLISLTFLPNSNSLQLDFSQRLRLRCPTQPGLVATSPLAQSALDTLRSIQRDHPLFSSLTEIIKFEAAQWQPKQIESPLSHAISCWQPRPTQNHDALINAEIQLALRLREARKCELSGQTETHMADLLFDGNLSQYQQLKALFLPN